MARAGVIEEGGSWRWRFDPDFWDKLSYDCSWRAIGAPRCPLAFIYGEQSSIATPERRTSQRQRAPAGAPFIGVPESGHHIMLEQPFALVTSIRSIVAL